MKVHLELPAPMEAKVDIDDEENTVVITPQFFRSVPTCVIGRIVVKGEKGTEREFILAVSAKGGISAQETDKQVTVEFDQLAPEEYRDRRKKVSERLRQIGKTTRKSGKHKSSDTASSPAELPPAPLPELAMPELVQAPARA